MHAALTPGLYVQENYSEVSKKITNVVSKKIPSKSFGINVLRNFTLEYTSPLILFTKYHVEIEKNAVFIETVFLFMTKALRVHCPVVHKIQTADFSRTKQPLLIGSYDGYQFGED